jgi:hypothetical protein
MEPNNSTPRAWASSKILLLWCRMRGQRGRMTAKRGKRKPGMSKFLLSLNCSANCMVLGRLNVACLGHVFQFGNKKKMLFPLMGYCMVMVLVFV